MTSNPVTFTREWRGVCGGYVCIATTTATDPAGKHFIAEIFVPTAVVEHFADRWEAFRAAVEEDARRAALYGLSRLI